MSPATLFVGLAAASAIAAIWDVTTRRVPNALTFGIIVVASAARGAMFGWSAALVAGTTALALLFVGTLAYERRWLGGGDIKLLAGLAAGFGLADTVALLLYTGVAGGLLAATYAFHERRLSSTAFHLAHGLLARTPLTAAPARHSVPYAVAIAVGATLVALSHTALPSLRMPL